MENLDDKTSKDFELKVDELKKIVDKLESDVSLDDGMKLFEKGLALTEECINYLNETRATLSALNDRLDTILGGDDE